LTSSIADQYIPAIARLFEWFLDPKEGHHLGGALQNRQPNFAFPAASIGFPEKGGKGKWANLALGIPDLINPEYVIVTDDICFSGSGGHRKLQNLLLYQAESAIVHPATLTRAIVVTNAPKDVKLSRVVTDTLGVESADYVENSWVQVGHDGVLEMVRAGAAGASGAPRDVPPLSSERCCFTKALRRHTA
jgi:hypothetical protein